MFDSHTQRLVAKHRRNGALLDTGLLLLLAVGEYSVYRIGTFKRTTKYSANDYNILRRLVSLFEGLLTTQAVLTETDNLGRELRDHEHESFSRAMRKIVLSSRELPRPSRQIMDTNTYSKYGLADSLSVFLSSEFLVVSDDWRLCSFISSQGGDIINFNHLKLGSY